MFQYVLANLLANNEDCLGVLFLDATGETVDMACAGLGPYEMRVAGAYLGIYLRQLRKLLAVHRLGQAELVHIEKSGTHVFAVPLPDGYFLAMIQRQPALVARSRASLEEAVRQLEREIFGGGYHGSHEL